MLNLSARVMALLACAAATSAFAAGAPAASEIHPVPIFAASVESGAVPWEYRAHMNADVAPRGSLR